MIFLTEYVFRGFFVVSHGEGSEDRTASQKLEKNEEQAAVQVLSRMRFVLVRFLKLLSIPLN